MQARLCQFGFKDLSDFEMRCLKLDQRDGQIHLQVAWN
jgi:hypothetical protein